MKIFQNIEDKLQKKYQPKKEPWKRKILFILSAVILLLLSIASYYQLNYMWANNDIWAVIGLFYVLSLMGLFASIFCSDFWVALLLGGF